jgi:hypothetical protein
LGVALCLGALYLVVFVISAAWRRGGDRTPAAMNRVPEVDAEAERVSQEEADEQQRADREQMRDFIQEEITRLEEKIEASGVNYGERLEALESQGESIAIDKIRA